MSLTQDGMENFTIKMSNQAVFVWIADIAYKDDTTEIATGDVTIIK
jgi:hypothetical protein